MNKSEVQAFINEYKDGEAIAMALQYFMNLKSKKNESEEEFLFLKKNNSIP